VLTTFDGDEDIFRAIQAGAKGYLLKDVPREALMDSIRRVHAGETCVPVHLAAKLAERVSGETLSAREIDVLKLMAQGKSNKEIGSVLFISEGTVKSHVKAIFAKMNVISRTEAVASATRPRSGLLQTLPHDLRLHRSLDVLPTSKTDRNGPVKSSCTK
jgi:DNA-binding NarL/FixJ family response regulator